MQTGMRDGMIPLEAHLRKLIESKMITPDQAGSVLFATTGKPGNFSNKAAA